MFMVGVEITCQRSMWEVDTRQEWNVVVVWVLMVIGQIFIEEAIWFEDNSVELEWFFNVGVAMVFWEGFVNFKLKKLKEFVREAWIFIGFLRDLFLGIVLEGCWDSLKS